jgi:hypothetical protein
MAEAEAEEAQACNGFATLAAKPGAAAMVATPGFG